jgi:hypothetical protein
MEDLSLEEKIKSEVESYLKLHLKDAIKNYIKENLVVFVSSDSKCGDYGYGDYRSYKSHTLTLELDGEKITETDFSTGD